ncbi:MAG: tRNA(Ile)-lysidine synthetase, partial [Chloroflexota bacterium]|nr:tRNA(Ile)-lysidine synthetase [Chloroflexota bacterium]
MAVPRSTIQTVRAFAREHALFRPGPLLVAVSGGTDSTALLLILRELADEHGLVLHVAHFDHRARPRASAADAQHVADLAARCGAPVRVGRAAAKP